MAELEGLALFQAILDRTDTELYLTSPDGSFAYVNEAAARSLGYSRDELMGLSILAIDPLMDAEALARLLRELKQRSHPPFETVHLHRDGRRIPKEITAIYFTVGEQELVCGLGRDITGRKEAETALRESEARYRLMVEGSEQVFFYLHGADHRFLFLSPSVVNVTGFAAAELLGQPYEVLLAGDPSDAVVEDLTERALRTGERSPTYSAVLRHKDGRKVVVELVETPLERDGALLIHGFARDITERRRAEAAERATRERLARILRTVPDGIVLVDGAGAVTFANEAAGRILGQPAAELVGTSLDALGLGAVVAVEAGAGGAAPVEDGAAASRPPAAGGEAELGSATVVVTRADGGHVVLSANATYLGAGDAGRVVSFQDVTARTQLEQLKSEFMSVAAHELRTPLTPLRLLVDRALETARGGAPVAVGTLERMERYCRRLSDLLRDLLDVARLERGRLVLRRAAVDLAALVAEVVEDYREQHSTRALRAMLPAAPLVVDADGARCAQVVANLLDNALRYSPADRAVEVAVRAVDDDVEITVHDDGPGIASADQAQLFSGLPRATMAAAAGEPGLGLGLFIARSLVELHGGTIGCDSAPGRGTTFVVRLPRG